MGGHVALQIEVGELITLLQLKQRLELGVGVDAATVLLVLQRVGADISVDLASNLGSGHLGTVGLAKKLGQLLGNGGGLHEAGGGAVADLAALLGTGLLGSAQLLHGMALKAAELGTKRGGKGNHLLQLGRNGCELSRNEGISGRNNGLLGSGVGNSRGNNGNGGSRRSRSRSRSRLGGLGCLNHLHGSRIRSSSRGSGSSSGSSSSRGSGGSRRSLGRLGHCGVCVWVWDCFIPYIQMSF